MRRMKVRIIGNRKQRERIKAFFFLRKWIFDHILGKKRASGAAAANEVLCVCVMGNVSLIGQELGTIQVAMVAKEFCCFFKSYSKKGGERGLVTEKNLM